MDRGINKLVILIAVISGFGGFLFGFDSSVVANIQDQVTAQLSLTTWEWSKVVSFSLLGAIFGIPLSGLIADRLSRRSLLKLVAIGFIVGTLLCAQARELNILLYGRFLIGICIGIASYIAPLFIAEIAPPQKRGALILINGLAITFGQAVAYLIGYFFHDISPTSWRFIVGMGIIPALVLFVGMFFVPHSPGWLMKRYGAERTLGTLKKIRAEGADIHAELDEIMNHINHNAIVDKRLFLKPTIIAVLSVGIGLGVFQQFSGINAILYYGPVIFESAGFVPVKNAILATFWIGLLNFIFTVVTLFYVDKIGRRSLLLGGTLLAALSLFVVCLFFQWHSSIQSFGVLIGLSCFVVGYCISVGSLFWVLISEIFPLKIRGMAMSIATVIQWGANFLVSISFLQIYQSYGEVFTFGLFALLCFLAFLFSYYFVPETTGVPLEKIESNLAAGKRIRELGQPISKSRDKQLELENSDAYLT
ncbi:putative metabolite transport protein CsbC [Legionella massiliensis]|uniref:Putative metabolite transport protein CsbC n=1 Tax=Legionella massiliensis TaxID=1034943 RepID=A0A078L016_9GAMM|nr:sugar porter family MFS transporter [Legionella massiliensis]CDZ77393.1 putative metabolite transport protein CsbC [Legionella massiliensis]CEE13131.1 putative metabolite transport protein CsbC [Legionella massiliensis]